MDIEQIVVIAGPGMLNNNGGTAKMIKMTKVIKKAMSIIFSLSLCICFSVPTVAAHSEGPSPWASEQVNAAISANLVPLSLQSEYAQPVTRAEFCVLAATLYESVKGEIKERKTFVDSNDINVEKMAAVGVVSGIGNDTFAPDVMLTREQAATMLSRLTGAIGLMLFEPLPTFDDNKSISAWASREVGKMQFAGIISGVGNNTFFPKGSYTREQSIVTIKRLYDALSLGTAYIRYDANGGSGAPSGHRANVAPSTGGDGYGLKWQQAVFVIPDEMPTRSGYEFRGWASDYYPDMYVHKAGDLFDALGVHVVDGLTITLTAVWDVLDMNLTDVVKIDLRGKGITDERLAELVASGAIPANVTQLDLAINHIRDVSPLGNLKYLTELNLWGNEVRDVYPLRNLTNLTKLNLWGNQFGDITPLGNLTKLVSLSLGDNTRFNGDLSVLSNFTDLTDLGLGDSGQGRMDFSPLEALVNLENLQIWGAGQLKDLSIIGGLAELNRLTIHAANISDFEPLSNLTKLTKLDLQGNRISEISSLCLHSFPDLTELALWNNLITDISELRGLTNLTFLALGSNQITDISPLNNLKKLKYLDLMNNPIARKDIEYLRAVLPNADIRSGDK